jgi:hypothetical protein
VTEYISSVLDTSSPRDRRECSSTKYAHSWCYLALILGIGVLIPLRLVIQADPTALEKMAFARTPVDNIDISSKPPKPSKERHLPRSPSANMSTANGPSIVSQRLKQLEVQSKSRLHAWRIRQYGMWDIEDRVCFRNRISKLRRPVSRRQRMWHNRGDCDPLRSLSRSNMPVQLRETPELESLMNLHESIYPSNQHTFLRHILKSNRPSCIAGWQRM